jgi:Holliday junction resolvase
MKSEKDVKKKVKALFDKHGYFWWSPPASAYGKSGISDIHAIHAGVFIVVETKFNGNKPTPLQVGFLNSVRAENGYAFVVDEKNIQFFADFLESFAIASEAQSRNATVPDEHGARMLNCIYALTRY